MSYVDSTFYKNSYKGNCIPDAELDSYLQKASDSIDQLTYYRISKEGGFSRLTTFQQGAVKLAVCTQADHLYTYGDIPSPNMAGYSINGNSVSFGSNVDLRYSRQAIDYLKPTNLMYRGL